MVNRVTPAGNQTAGGAASAANYANKMPGGWIGYAEVTTNQTAMTGTVDLTGLTETVTVNSLRRIKITVSVSGFTTTTGGTGERAELRIQEGATVLNSRRIYQPSTLDNTGPAVVTVILAPSSGSHTYKATFNRSAGVGGSTWDMLAGSGTPAYLLVEDVGSTT